MMLGTSAPNARLRDGFSIGKAIDNALGKSKIGKRTSSAGIRQSIDFRIVNITAHMPNTKKAADTRSNAGLSVKPSTQLLRLDQLAIPSALQRFERKMGRGEVFKVTS